MTPAQLLASNTALSGEVLRTQEALKIALRTIDKLKVEVAYLRRMKYGRSSEQLEHAQLELVGGKSRRQQRQRTRRWTVTPTMTRTAGMTPPTSAHWSKRARSAKSASKPAQAGCPSTCPGES